MNLELDQFKDVYLVIDKANDVFIQRQFVSQGDYKGRSLTVQVTNNGNIGEVPGLTLNLNWHNEASGLTDLTAFTILDKENSIFRIEYPENMMTPGKVYASIQIIQDGKVTNLRQFELIVQKLAGQPVGITKEAEFSALVAVLADSNKFRTDIDKIRTDIDKKADKTFVTEQLAEKANKDEVTSVMTPKGTLAYASLPTTGNEIGWYYYCPDGDGTHGAGNYVWNGASWFFGGTGDEGYNLLKKDLTNQFDTRFYADGTGENKCNPYTMTNGKLDVTTGFINTTDTACKTSDFIPIPDGETKVVASMRSNASISYQRISFYKSDKSFISCTYSGTVAVDVPSEAKCVRVSNIIDEEHYVGFNSDGTYGGFVPYVVGKLRDDRTPSGLATDDELELLKGDMNSRFPIQPDQTTFFTVEKSTNLLSSNVSEFSVGRLKDGNLDETKNTFLTSPMIVISENDGKYVVVKTASTGKGTNAHAFYDANGNYITGYNFSEMNGFILIPDNAFYFRFSTVTNLNVKYFVGINEEPSPDIPYEPYYKNILINPEYVNKSELNDSWYKGKKGFGLGDSITANGSTYTASDGRTGSAWREFVATMLELSETVYNCGVGGSKVSGVNNSNPAMWTDERINAIPTDCDFGFFNGGMNDWGGNVQLGDVDSADTNTFYGALNVIAKKLTQRFPTHPIFWMSTTYGYNGESPDGKNAIGLTQYDYGRAIIKVAEKNGFIPIDLHALCGWNEYNVSQFVNDESTTEFAVFIHPNRNGGKKMATAICSVVKTYQPCELE